MLIYQEVEGDKSTLYPESYFKNMKVNDLDIYSKIESYWINYKHKENKPIELYKFIDNNDLTIYGYPKMWDGSKRCYINRFPKKKQVVSVAKKGRKEPFDIGEAGREFLREYNLYKSQGDKNPN